MTKDSLTSRLAEIKRVIPFEKLLDRKSDEIENIATYYRLNRLAYRLINSRHGFVHMGISKSGVLKDEDLLEHARLISEYIEKGEVSAVLELAAGKAATTKFPAKSYPEVAFTGLDLPGGQLDTRSSRFSNLTLVEGDYSDLSQFEDEAF